MAYLDHAATTPLRPVARQAWLDTVDQLGGNPNALHAGGRKAKLLLEDARASLADTLGADRAEVFFTSGATESAVLGVSGVAERMGLEAVTASHAEHPAVTDQRGNLERQGVGWDLFPIDEDGVSVITSPGPLSTLAYVCSETGIIQPLQDLVASSTGLVHTDATQAFTSLPLHFHGLGVDLMTIGGHKFGAPVGTGALLARREVGATRPGTPDVAGAVALAAAAREAASARVEANEASSHLRGLLLEGVSGIEGVALTSPASSVPSIVHLSLPTSHPEIVLLELDRHGVYASAGAACKAGVTRPSEVLLAMGRTEAEARGGLRVSFGWTSSEGDVERFITALPQALDSAQRMDQYDRHESFSSTFRRG